MLETSPDDVSVSIGVGAGVDVEIGSEVGGAGAIGIFIDFATDGSQKP